VDVVLTPVQAPNCNAFAERWVLSIKAECLGRMISFGANSLRRACSSFVAHYHVERAHQGLGIELLGACWGRPVRVLLLCLEPAETGSGGRARHYGKAQPCGDGGIADRLSSRYSCIEIARSTIPRYLCDSGSLARSSRSISSPSSVRPERR